MLADELMEMAVRVETAKTMAGRTAGIERGKFLGEALSWRLAILYRIEDNWGDVIEALRRSSTRSDSAPENK